MTNIDPGHAGQTISLTLVLLRKSEAAREREVWASLLRLMDGWMPRQPRDRLLCFRGSTLCTPAMLYFLTGVQALQLLNKNRFIVVSLVLTQLRPWQ